MLDTIPLSALALCYGPLAVMIIGFIGFAFLTDADARRTYLRRMDPRPEDEQPSRDPLPITETVNAETPSGARVTLTPSDTPGIVVSGEQMQLPSPEEVGDQEDTN